MEYLNINPRGFKLENKVTTLIKRDKRERERERERESEGERENEMNDKKGEMQNQRRLVTNRAKKEKTGVKLRNKDKGYKTRDNELEDRNM